MIRPGSFFCFKYSKTLRVTLIFDFSCPRDKHKSTSQALGAKDYFEIWYVITKIIKATIIKPNADSAITSGCINGIVISGCTLEKLYPVKMVRLK